MKHLAPRAVQGLSFASAAASLVAAVEAPTAANVATVLAGAAAFVGTAGMVQRSKVRKARESLSEQAPPSIEETPDGAPLPPIAERILTAPTGVIQIATPEQVRLYANRIVGADGHAVHAYSGGVGWAMEQRDRQRRMRRSLLDAGLWAWSPVRVMVRAGLALAVALAVVWGLARWLG